MTRGYYYAVSPDGTRCQHRHYELSRALARCSSPRGVGGLVRYVDDTGCERPARTDELAELEARSNDPKK